MDRVANKKNGRNMKFPISPFFLKSVRKSSKNPSENFDKTCFDLHKALRCKKRGESQGIWGMRLNLSDRTRGTIIVVIGKIDPFCMFAAVEEPPRHGTTTRPPPPSRRLSFSLTAAGGGGVEGARGGGVLDIMHGRGCTHATHSRMAVHPRMPTMPGREGSDKNKNQYRFNDNPVEVPVRRWWTHHTQPTHFARFFHLFPVEQFRRVGGPLLGLQSRFVDKPLKSQV